MVGELESCNGGKGGRKLVGEWQLFVREMCEDIMMQNMSLALRRIQPLLQVMIDLAEF